MSSTPPATRDGAAFGDSRSCREWLGALPLTNIPQAQYLVLEALRALGRDEAFDPLERLKCLELVRDKVAYLQSEQRTRYFGKSLPLSSNDTDAWRSSRSLLEELEAGYRKCLDAAAKSPALASHQALIAQRAMRYIGAQMLFHAIIYRRFDPRLWERLHAMYARMESAGLADEIVKDTLEGEEGTSSVGEAYVRVVMLQAAYLSEVTAPQMDFIEHLIRMWIRRVPIRKKPAEGAGALSPLVVDLGKAIGARPHLSAEVGESQRILDVEQVSRSIRKRVHALQNGEAPETMGLAPETPVGDALDQLKRVHRLWCEGVPPRPPAKVPKEKAAGLVFGLNEIWFFATGGKAFEQPDRKRELTRQEKQDLEVFGQVSARTQAMMLSEHNYTVESWGVVDEMLGAWRIARPPTSSRGVTIGRLVAMRVGDAGPFFLGKLSALSQEGDKVVATVTLFPGKPEAVPVRASDARNRANAQWSHGFRLAGLEKAKLPPSMVVGTNVAARGRGIEVWEGPPLTGRPKECTVEEILDHGTDFDRITFF
jgi:cyclic-di-GMP-binding protein